MRIRFDWISREEESGRRTTYTRDGRVAKRDNVYREYTALRQSCTAFICSVILLGVHGGCSPDLRTIRGTLAAAASALEADDGRALFELLDCRARNALYSISRERRASAQLIAEAYPPHERARALQELGPAAVARDAADLFSMRCPSSCRTRLSATLGAPVGQRGLGDEVEVHTARGGRVRLHHCPDAGWGLVWNTGELGSELRRATHEHRQIERNARTFRLRRAQSATLERGVAPP